MYLKVLSGSKRKANQNELKTLEDKNDLNNQHLCCQSILEVQKNNVLLCKFYYLMKIFTEVFSKVHLSTTMMLSNYAIISIFLISEDKFSLEYKDFC